MQTPNVEQTVMLTINDRVLRLAGTFFFRAEDTLQIEVLEGYGEVEETIIPAGARLEGSEAVPSNPDALAALSFNNLPRRVRMPQMPTAADITEQVDALRAEQIPPPLPTEVVVDASRCIRETRRS